MDNRESRFNALLDTFPQDCRPILSSVVGQAGRISAEQCRKLGHIMGLKLETLTLRLLPLARCFAVVPVSGYEVGAIALAGAPDPSGPIECYLGANIEFTGVPMNNSIHAEQAAIVNAWLQGADRLHSLAVSETPCGHCRQFIMETEQAAAVEILLGDPTVAGCRRVPLSTMLPEAFGPQDLNQSAGLISAAEPEHKLAVSGSGTDAVLDAALSAARKSYAPYSKNYAGCAIQTAAGDVFSGRSVESAAYNPGLTALQAAISRLNLVTLQETVDITRVVMVERPTAVSQHRFADLLLARWKPQMTLEYHEAY